MPFKTVKTFNADTSTWFSLHALVQFGKETARFDFKELPDTGDPAKDAKNAQWVGQSMRIDNDKLPSNFQNIKPGTIVEDVMALIDTKEKKAISINPWEGTFDAICFELGSTKAGRDENNRPLFDYLPKEETKWNRDVRKFWAGYEITDDPEYAQIFKGCKPRYHLQMALVDDGHGMAGSDGNAYYKGKLTQTGKFLDWTNTHEIDQDMEWPADGNPLPELETRILALNKPVRIHIVNGWIARVSKARGAAVRVVAEDEPEEKPGTTDTTFGTAEA